MKRRFVLDAWAVLALLQAVLVTGDPGLERLQDRIRFEKLVRAGTA